MVAEIAALTQSPVGLAARLGALDAFRRMAESALRELGALYEGLPQPMSPVPWQALKLAREIAFALSSGYGEAAVQRASSPGLAPVTKLAPVLLQAMRYAAAAIRTSYETYAQVPRGYWRHLHQLYLLAERERVLDGAADPESGMSVGALYSESLLLSLADPYRLAAGEMQAAEALLRELRVSVALGKEPPETPPASHFVVSCEGDAGPRPLSSPGEREAGPDDRVLDTTTIVERLRAMQATLGADADRDGSLPFLSKLIALWHNPPTRAHPRDPSGGSVAICVGVKAIAQFVAHDAKVDGEAQGVALRRGITMPMLALPSDDRGELVPIHEWAIVNLSAGGARVRRSAATSYPITVGEIVGIRAPDKASWMVGVTRWITALDDGATEFGLQFFGNAVCPIWVKAAARSGAPKLGLLVGGDDEGVEERLLTPPGTYAIDAQFHLHGEDFRSRVQATAIMEQSAYFELFRVAPA